MTTGGVIQGQLKIVRQVNGEKKVIDTGLNLRGDKRPTLEFQGDIQGVRFHGGPSGTSYADFTPGEDFRITDQSGMTFSTWVYFDKGQSIWERLLDIGASTEGPYMFLTRKARGVCFAGEDIATEYYATIPDHEWLHLAITIDGTKGGTNTYAGPKIYLNGSCVADGAATQTASGRYGSIRNFFTKFEEAEEMNWKLGRSSFQDDPDFSGMMSQMVLADYPMSEEEILETMCQGLTDEKLLALAMERYLIAPKEVFESVPELPDTLIGGRLKVTWSYEGLAETPVEEVNKVILTGTLSVGSVTEEVRYELIQIPTSAPTHGLTIDGQAIGTQISPDLYGLFYEDINNAADGGLYAEMVQNRSFEAFVFDTYDQRSGIHGTSTGRNHTPLRYWFGDLDKVTARMENTLGQALACEDPRASAVYVAIEEGAKLMNRGFCDDLYQPSMIIRKGENYHLSLWLKDKAAVKVYLADGEENMISNMVTIEQETKGWHKHGGDQALILTAEGDCHGQLVIEAISYTEIESISLMPENVWGSSEEQDGPKAANNHKSNVNYRLRRDLVLAMKAMKPRFLRFPGGCISEGSYIWENVYDWRESMGPVETRIENFNVWGYMMTMGLGYHEYFQLAEDLEATPLPVMACGVLCQARSDYAHPAGGKLRVYYVQNFIDLIDYALSMDFDHNPYAKLRRDLGHEGPFDLRYLGVGNENWGHEFYANFEIFKKQIDNHMEAHYPGHELMIISTVGAQGDDDAYQNGWKFLGGHLEESPTVAFSDGENELISQVTYYHNEKDYMATIADEHYYRSNEYLLNNCDRYDYYEEGSMVFVGEYASTDKNTLAGALAEAAIMTHFEESSDVVKLAATAPLFNKVRADGLYRWTPDCIWFDDDSVWYTPNYHIQAMFAGNIGDRTLKSWLSTYVDDQLTPLASGGNIEIPIEEGQVLLQSLQIKSLVQGEMILETSFNGSLPNNFLFYGEGLEVEQTKEGLLMTNTGLSEEVGLVIIGVYDQVEILLTAAKNSGKDGLSIGFGHQLDYRGYASSRRFVTGYLDGTTGLRVIKKNVEGYKLGDFASSIAAGNMRAAYKKELEYGRSYQLKVTMDSNTESLVCWTDNVDRIFKYKLKPYMDEFFRTVSEDDEHIYIKLVNTDDRPMRLAVTLEHISIDPLGQMITLKGDMDLLNQPNVNGKLASPFEPVQERYELGDVWHIPAKSARIYKFLKI